VSSQFVQYKRVEGKSKMCWQCAATKPSEYLRELFGENFRLISWYWGSETGDGVCEFELLGSVYHTNPKLDPQMLVIGAVPGETDADGVPFFLSGEYKGTWVRKTKTYCFGCDY